MAGDPAVLRTGLSLSGLTHTDLWVRYFGLGGTLSPRDLREYIEGSPISADGQYNVIAQALNERFMELDLDHPVPYDPQ